MYNRLDQVKLICSSNLHCCYWYLKKKKKRNCLKIFLYYFKRQVSKQNMSTLSTEIKYIKNNTKWLFQWQNSPFHVTLALKPCVRVTRFAVVNWYPWVNRSCRFCQRNCFCLSHTRLIGDYSSWQRQKLSYCFFNWCRYSSRDNLSCFCVKTWIFWKHHKEPYER